MVCSYIKCCIVDLVLCEKVMFDYIIGCKCILILNDYYLVFMCENVDVIIFGIVCVELNVIVIIDGMWCEVDCLIFGIGFYVMDLFLCGVLFGSQGVDIVDVWDKYGVEVYLGIIVLGFLNFFMVVGLNMGLGYLLMVFMIELQVVYIVDVFKLMCVYNVVVIDVCFDVQCCFNDGIQKWLLNVIWLVGGCVSWYFDLKIGKNIMLWLGFMWQFCCVIVYFWLVDYCMCLMIVLKGVLLCVFVCMVLVV